MGVIVEYLQLVNGAPSVVLVGVLLWWRLKRIECDVKRLCLRVDDLTTKTVTLEVVEKIFAAQSEKVGAAEDAVEQIIKAVTKAQTGVEGRRGDMPLEQRIAKLKDCGRLDALIRRVDHLETKSETGS